MKRKHFLIIAFIFFHVSAFAQQRQFDSLKFLLKQHTDEDENKLQVLNAISFIQANIKPDDGIKSADEAIVLAQKLNNQKELAAAYNNKGFNQLRQNANDKALENLQKALSINTAINNQNGMADNYCNIGEVLRRQNKGENAKKDFEKALSISEKIQNKNGMADALYYLGFLYKVDDEKSKDCFLKAAALYEQTVNESGLAYSLDAVGAYYSMTSDYSNSVIYYNKAIVLNERNKNLYGLSLDYSNEGNDYGDLGNYPKQIEFEIKALKIAEATGNHEVQNTNLINIAVCYNAMKQFDRAKEYLIEALNVAEKYNYKSWQSTCYQQLGNVAMNQNNMDSALHDFQIAVIFAEQFNDDFQLSESYYFLGEYYLKTENISLAIVNYQKAVALSKKINRIDYTSSDLNGLSKAILKASNNTLVELNINPAQRFSIVEQKLKESLAMSKETESLEQVRDALQELSSLYEMQGDEKKSFNYYKQYVAAKDSVMNSVNVKTVTNLQIQYETEKKEQQISLLSKEKELNISELKRQKLVMNSTIGGVGIIGIFSFLLVRSSNRKKKSIFEKQVSEVEMKALRSQMNPHFIFNALQSVNDFILKKDTMNASNFLIKFSKLMRSVLENSVHKEVTIEKDMASLELYMQLESSRLDFPFDYEIIIDPKIDPEITFIPPLILQPFVENSIWHGLNHKKEKGRIKIEIKEDGNSIICSIEDNGVGREMVNLLKQHLPEKRESLGIQVTKERLRILEQIKNFRSRIEVIDLKDALNNPLGLRVELSLPLATLN